MFIHLEGIIERSVTTRMVACTCLVTRVVARSIARRGSQKVRTMVRVFHVECFRLANHAKPAHTNRMAFSHVEIQTATGKHSATPVTLMTFLLQMAANEGGVQFLTACTVKIIAVGRATAVTGVVTVAHIEITVNRTGIEVDIKAHIGSGRSGPRRSKRIVDSCLYGAVETGFTVFLHDQVDNSGSSFRGILGTWIGDDFYLFNRACGHLLQYLTAVLAVQACRLAVNPYFHVFGVAERDVSFLVNIYGRNIFQHFTHTGTCRSNILVHGEYFLIQLKAHGAVLPDHFHVLQHAGIFFEGDTTYVNRLTGNGHFAALVAVTHERYNKYILAVCQLYAKLTLFVRYRSCYRCLIKLWLLSFRKIRHFAFRHFSGRHTWHLSFRRVQHAHIGKVYWLFCAGVNHFSGHTISSQKPSADGQ